MYIIHKWKDSFEKCCLKILSASIIRISGLIQPKEDFALDKIKRILIYGTLGIGNMALFSSVIKSLRERLPDAEIRLLFFNHGQAQNVISGSRLVDKIISCGGLSPVKRVRTALEIRRWSPDLIVARFDNSISYALVTCFSNAPYRLGHIDENSREGYFNSLYNIKVAINLKGHEIDDHINLLKNIGINSCERKAYFHINDSDRCAVDGFLSCNGFRRNEDYITIQCGTSEFGKWRRWDLDKFADLIKLLSKKGIKTILVGSEDEKYLENSIINRLGSKPTTAMGVLSLKQTAEVIRRSRVLVCHDSGLMHIATAVDTPAIAIFGPSTPGRSGPLGNNNVIIRKELECSPCFLIDRSRVLSCKNRLCLSGISVEEVLHNVVLKMEKKHEAYTDEKR